ncbi:MAG TPA: MarR family transcriptional regulator [Candidatus Polarisedimenticolaceae bacterium]|nr:MarR family transcriptional regulator [Candidatus Polarisedimenticolaceae bacterium]
MIAALRRIVRAIDLHSRQLVELFNVTGPQLIALQELARLGPVPVGLLARNVHVSHPTMTGILDRLERRGLALRTKDTADRRRITVHVTRIGRELLEAAPSPLQDRFRAEFAKLEEWEQTQMLSTLQRIAAMMNVEALEASPVLTSDLAVSAATEILPITTPLVIPHTPAPTAGEPSVTAGRDPGEPVR